MDKPFTLILLSIGTIGLISYYYYITTYNRLAGILVIPCYATLYFYAIFNLSKGDKIER